ncbi:MAG TPA: DAK2 domain-containing protein, partial [Polyangiaceae bacterium]|nr:DAK2 domain-containing protein [Polyangiaceae bacterium]
SAVMAAERAAEATAGLVAKRGRAAYTGERSIGTLDPGAVAIGVIAKAVAESLRHGALLEGVPVNGALRPGAPSA